MNDCDTWLGTRLHRVVRRLALARGRFLGDSVKGN